MDLKTGARRHQILESAAGAEFSIWSTVHVDECILFIQPGSIRLPAGSDFSASGFRRQGRVFESRSAECRAVSLIEDQVTRLDVMLWILLPQNMEGDARL